jgi:hypothetical protein
MGGIAVEGGGEGLGKDMMCCLDSQLLGMARHDYEEEFLANRDIGWVCPDSIICPWERIRNASEEFA